MSTFSLPTGIMCVKCSACGQTMTADEWAEHRNYSWRLIERAISQVDKAKQLVGQKRKVGVLDEYTVLSLRVLPICSNQHQDVILCKLDKRVVLKGEEFSTDEVPWESLNNILYTVE